MEDEVDEASAMPKNYQIDSCFLVIEDMYTQKFDLSVLLKHKNIPIN
jgi:hypothetical protein